VVKQHYTGEAKQTCTLEITVAKYYRNWLTFTDTTF